jgi:endonuclease YncB( thermonuclease family)
MLANNYTYKVVKVTKVVDGDTIDVVLDLGCHVYTHRRLRFLGVDTEELRGGTVEQKLKAGLAKKFVETSLRMAEEIYVMTKMDAEGKYGRLLATVFTFDGALWENINEKLVTQGYGKVYNV